MEKPKVHITSKGFKILPVTTEHILAWGGIGLCDSCNNRIIDGKYIAVLNSCYCGKCFEDWHKHATNHPEDSGYEKAKLDEMLFRIEIA